jgi:hypothetical protein
LKASLQDRPKTAAVGEVRVRTGKQKEEPRINTDGHGWSRGEINRQDAKVGKRRINRRWAQIYADGERISHKDAGAKG